MFISVYEYSYLDYIWIATHLEDWNNLILGHWWKISTFRHVQTIWTCMSLPFFSTPTLPFSVLACCWALSFHAMHQGATPASGPISCAMSVMAVAAVRQKKKQKNEGESLTSRKPALKRCVNGILLKRSEIVMNDIWHQQKTRSVYCGSVRDPVFRGPPWLEPICRLPRPTNHPTLDSFDLSRLKSIG